LYFCLFLHRLLFFLTVSSSKIISTQLMRQIPFLLIKLTIG
jgi:hypothetical protein